MVMGLLCPCGSQITTTTVAGTGKATHDLRAMLACFGVRLLLLLRSRDRFRVGEPRISRVDVVLLFRLISSVVGSCSSV